MTRKVEKTETVTRAEDEPFALLHRKDGGDDVILYERRLDYYRTCGEPDADERARQEASLIRPLLAEERERRLALVWGEILRRVKAVLADRPAASEDSPCTGSDGDTAGSSDK